MSLSQKEIEHIAHLARLKIDSADLPMYTQNISDILEFIAQMSAVDTRTIEAMAHPLEAVQRLREDEVTEDDQHVLFQSIAPLTEVDLYLVPRVLEEVE